MTDDRDLTALLRDGMAAEARPVTADQAFVAETIALATRPVPAPSARPPAWRGWIVPAVAAVIVALLIGSVFLGGKLLHSEKHSPVLNTPTPTAPAPSHSVGKPAPSASPTSKPSGSPTSPSTSPVALVPPSGGAVPAGFRAVDLTWTSTTEGFALGTAPCQTAPCTSIVRTTDGGQHWVGLPAPKAELTEDGTQKCASNCVTNLRFATPLIGYAYGETTMYLTTDGGAHWVKQDGGAHALEIADGIVVRIAYARADCPDVGTGSGCPFKLLRAPVGSNAWQDIRLPAGALNTGVTLARSGPLVVVGTFGNPAGGAEDAHAVLFSSTDDGATWSRRADPCPTIGAGSTAAHEVDTTQITTAADRSVTVLCQERGDQNLRFTMTSTNAGQSFVRTGQNLPDSADGTELLAAASARTLFVQIATLVGSSNAGATWRAVTAPAQLSSVGFESATVGHGIGVRTAGTVGSPVVWRTYDAGATWQSYTFP